jgi:cbb3-type cytochrome oxidase maturation protein
MGIVFVLLPISLLLAFFGLIAYLWSVKSGQFEDLDTPSRRILLDDEELADVEKHKD